MRIFVDRKPISSTVPSESPTTIQSPAWNGESKSIISDPKKFATMSLAAKARAKPPIPRPARSDTTLTPRFWIIISTPRIISSILMALLSRGISWLSRVDSVLEAAVTRNSESIFSILYASHSRVALRETLRITLMTISVVPSKPRK